MEWLWWFGGAVLLAILEVLSVDLVFVMFAGGALAGAVAAWLGAELWVQLVVAAVTSVLLLGSLRPWLLRHLRGRMPLVETNAAALVGGSAVVLSTVSGDEGRIKLRGEVWSARTDPSDALPPGTDVTVTRIDGATAVVVRAARPSGEGAPGQPQP
ncbi:NfeD family protein [Cellulomonas soli]